MLYFKFVYGASKSKGKEIEVEFEVTDVFNIITCATDLSSVFKFK